MLCVQATAFEASLSGYSTSGADDKSAGGVHPHLPGEPTALQSLLGRNPLGLIQHLLALAREHKSCTLAIADKQKTSDFTNQHEEPTGSQKTADKAAGHKGEDVDQRVAPAQDQGEGDSNVPQGGTGKKPKKDHIPGVDIGGGQSPD